MISHIYILSVINITFHTMSQIQCFLFTLAGGINIRKPSIQATEHETVKSTMHVIDRLHHHM